MKPLLESPERRISGSKRAGRAPGPAAIGTALLLLGAWLPARGAEEAPKRVVIGETICVPASSEATEDGDYICFGSTELDWFFVPRERMEAYKQRR